MEKEEIKRLEAEIKRLKDKIKLKDIRIDSLIQEKRGQVANFVAWKRRFMEAEEDVL